jgi:hypothetical protein
MNCCSFWRRTSSRCRGNKSPAEAFIWPATLVHSQDSRSAHAVQAGLNRGGAGRGCDGDSRRFNDGNRRICRTPGDLVADIDVRTLGKAPRCRERLRGTQADALIRRSYGDRDQGRVRNCQVRAAILALE